MRKYTAGVCRYEYQGMSFSIWIQEFYLSVIPANTPLVRVDGYYGATRSIFFAVVAVNDKRQPWRVWNRKYGYAFYSRQCNSFTVGYNTLVERRIKTVLK